MSPSRSSSPSPWRIGTHRVLLLCLLSACGCVFRGNVESLEARLREQETRNSEYRRQLQQLEQELSVAEKENELLRRSVSQDGAQMAAFEVQRTLAEVVGLKFNTLLTAVQKSDSAGEERLHAVIYPHDADGEVVKIAGDLSLEAIDPTLAEGERTIAKWDIPASEAKSAWHAGFLSTGFLIDAPWDRPPQGTVLILHARLKTPDGREFDATHTVTRKRIGPEPTGQDKSSLGTEFPEIESTEVRRVPAPVDPGNKSMASANGLELADLNRLRTSDTWTIFDVSVRR